MTARMSPAEAVMLCRFAKACCPQQQFDEYTPDAWHELLGDYPFDDCKAAVTAVAKRQPFVAPAEIRAEVRRIRYRRIEEFGPFDPPAEIEGVRDYQRWLRDMQTRIADGDLTRDNYAELEGPTREMPALEGVFRRVPPE